MTDDELISREEVLAGLPARRANTLLFLIENRTAQIVARSRVEFALTEQATHERDMAFLEAFALGNASPLHPTIQHLERHASNWASLVPSNPRLKAAIAHALGQKYTFTYQVIPNIRAALGLEEKAIQVAYSRLYRTQLAKIFAPKLSFIEQLRWTLSAIAQKLESLPPFWLATLLTVALGLPQAFLALPIAVANIGPLPTVAFLIIIGIINIFTMVCMAEAIGRSGDFRYGNAFIKQLASNYLGNIGSSILSLAVGIRVFLIALACYIGLSVTMANFTQISPALWAVILFCVGLYLLLRKSLNFTVAVMLFLAAINVSILLILSLLALSHIQLDNLLYINLPFVRSETFQPVMLQQFLGVSLMLYFGHIYVGECGKLVLPRDSSASSLIWGTAMGTAVLTVLFCLWVIAVNGAISPHILSEQSGTALDPLVLQIGPVVKVLGAILVTLLLGMAWLRSSSLLLNLVREWFPAQPQPQLMLPRQKGTVILHPRTHSTDVPYIGLTYLGMEATQPKFRLDIQLRGNIHHIEIITTQRWEAKELFRQFPELRKWDTSFSLEVRSANQDAACIRITSAMVLVYEGSLKADVNNATPDETSQINQQNIKTKTQKLWTNILSQRRFLVSISPLVLVFLLTEWLCLTGVQSFSNILAFAGVLGNTIVGGIFPVLMLISSRRKGELVPGVVFHLLNHPVLIVAIYSIFIGILFFHGLFIWQNPVARFGALGIAILSLLATFVMKRYGAFASRVVVELQEQQQLGGHSIFKITAGGRPQVAEIRLGYVEGEQSYQASTVEIPSLESLKYAIFHLPIKKEKELRVWTHKNSFQLESKILPAFVELENGGKKMQFDLKLSSGKVLLPIANNDCLLKFTFP